MPNALVARIIAAVHAINTAMVVESGVLNVTNRVRRTATDQTVDDLELEVRGPSTDGVGVLVRDRELARSASVGSSSGEVHRQSCSTSLDGSDLSVGKKTSTLARVLEAGSVKGIDLDIGIGVVVVRLGRVHYHVTVHNGS